MAVAREARNTAPARVSPDSGLEYVISPAKHAITAEEPVENATLQSGGQPAEGEASSFRLRQLPPELLSTIDVLSFQNQKSPAMMHLRRVKSSPILSAHFLDRDKARNLAEAVARTSQPDRALHILSLAHKLGCKLKHNAYECVAYQLAVTRQWHLIAPIAAMAKRNIGRTTTRLLNWRVRALVETHQYSRLPEILDEFNHEKLKPTQRTFHILLSGYLRNRDLSMAKECFQKMEAAGFAVHPSTHALVLSSYRSLGPDGEVVAQAYEALRDADDVTATLIVNCLIKFSADSRDLFGIFECLSLFDQQQLTPSLANSGDDSILVDGEGAPVPHSSSDSISVSPNTATFSLLLDFLIKRRDFHRACRMIEKMVVAGIKPNSSTAARLVRIYFEAGDAETPVRIVADMCGRYKVPTSLFTLLGSSSRGQSRLPSWLSQVPPTIGVFHALMKGVLQTRGLDGARLVLRIMLRSGIQPDGITVEIIMAHLEKTERARPRELIRLLRTLSSPSVRPTLRHIHIILRSILRREKSMLHGIGWNVAAAKFSPIRQDTRRADMGRISGTDDLLDPTAGIQLPPARSYRGLLRSIVQSLRTHGVRSDRATFALRIMHDAATKSDLQAALKAFRAMIARGMHPNEYHFSALMEGYAKTGNLAAARETMAAAVKAGVKPDVVMYTILIVGHARQGQPELATRVFQEMIGAGISPDRAAVDAVASAYFAVGAYRMAKHTLLSLWRLVLPYHKEPEGVSLQTIAREMRLLHRGDHPCATPTRQTRLTREDQHAPRRKLRRLIEEWKDSRGDHPAGERKHRSRMFRKGSPSDLL